MYFHLEGCYSREIVLCWLMLLDSVCDCVPYVAERLHMYMQIRVNSVKHLSAYDFIKNTFSNVLCV